MAASWPKCLELVIPLKLSINDPDAEGTTPLHLAAQSGDAAVVQALVRAGAAVNAQDHSGNTPLHSIFFGEEFRPDIEFPVFHAMVAAGVDRSIRNTEDKTAFDLATQWHYPMEYLELLKPGPSSVEHAKAFIWLGDDRYCELLPKAMVSVELDEKTWPSCEHYFHAQKTADACLREHMRQAPTAADALCRLRDVGSKVSSTWHQKCDEVMRAALLAKFKQHAHLREKLIETGTAMLISDSNCDWYWAERPGVVFNTIGQMLMSIRDGLRTVTELV
jgi:hypothetical protein